MTITATVVAPGGTSVQNTATATADDPIARPELLSSAASITSVARAPIQPLDANLEIAKRVNHATAQIGEPLTYTITVSNHGPATATSPTVTDAFSAVVHVESIHAPAGGSCKTGAEIKCTLASIPNAKSEKITIVAKPTIAGKLRNTASVASPTPDPDPANNTAHATTNVQPGTAALRITKTADHRSVKPGETFSFTIVVRSLGPAKALGVKVCDRLGSGMTYVSVDHASFRHGSACWTVASLAKGDLRRYTVNVRAPSTSGPRRLTNTATVAAKNVRTHTAHATVELRGAPPPSPPSKVTG